MSNCKCVVFSDRAYNDIVVETKKKNPLETGGILLGHILDNGIWVVMEVLPPGPKSIFEYAYFEYDEQFVNYLAQSKATEYEQELNLLGLWHRHPGSMDTFSGTDDGTNRIFAGLNPQGAISGLVNIDPKFRLTMYHVSNPLQYNRVAVEVGDDLIPEEYFKLKYPSSNGLNPVLTIEKKNESTNTGRSYAIGSAKENIGKNERQKGGIVAFLGRTNIFSLLFLFLLGFSCAFSCAFNKVKGTDGIRAMYKMAYSTQPNQYIPAVDSATYVATGVWGRREAEVRDGLRNSSELRRDSVARNSFVREHLAKISVKKEDKGYVFVVDSLASAYNCRWIENRVSEQRESFIEAEIDKYLTKTECDYRNTLERRVKIKLALAWILTILSLIAAIFLKARNHFDGKRERIKPWFQRHPNLYHKEEDAIKAKFRDVERNADNGVLSYFIATDKSIYGQDENLSFQLVFASDYDKSGEIKIYLVTPELSEMLGAKISGFPYVEKDGAGEYYLDLLDSIRKGNVSGVGVISQLCAWLRQYEMWRKREITINEFKI